MAILDGTEMHLEIKESHKPAECLAGVFTLYKHVDFILKNIVVPSVILKITFLSLSKAYGKKELFPGCLVDSKFLLL